MRVTAGSGQLLLFRRRGLIVLAAAHYEQQHGDSKGDPLHCDDSMSGRDGISIVREADRVGAKIDFARVSRLHRWNIEESAIPDNQSASRMRTDRPVASLPSALASGHAIQFVPN